MAHCVIIVDASVIPLRWVITGARQPPVQDSRSVLRSRRLPMVVLLSCLPSLLAVLILPVTLLGIFRSMLVFMISVLIILISVLTVLISVLVLLVVIVALLPVLCGGCTLARVRPPRSPG